MERGTGGFCLGGGEYIGDPPAPSAGAGTVERPACLVSCQGGPIQSRGYSLWALFAKGKRAVFVYGFPKSERANIDAVDEKQFKEASRHVLRLSKKEIAELVREGEFLEVSADEQEISK